MGRDVQRRDVLARKKRGADIGKTKRGKGTKLMWVADGRCVPLGVRTPLAFPAEVTRIEFICPHRSNRKRPVLKDGRSLRRYRGRWTIKRTVAWLGNFRRLLVRYERKSKMFLAFLKVACLMITLRQF